MRGRFFIGTAPAGVSRPSSCLPLTREVANPEGLTEGEIRRAYAKGDAQSKLVANSLPQSPAATAPSSEGAKGAVCRRGSAQREPRGWNKVFCSASSESANGGPGGISPLVSRPPGGLSVHFPPVESGRFPRKTGFAGAPVDLTASVAAHSGSLRHDGGTRRRSPLCGQTAQALRGLRARRRAYTLSPTVPSLVPCLHRRTAPSRASGPSSWRPMGNWVSCRRSSS